MHGGPFLGLLLLDCKSFFIAAQIYGRTLLPEVPYPFRSVTEHDWWLQCNSCLLWRSLSYDCSNTLCWQMCFPWNSISETEVIDQTPLWLFHYVQIIAKSRETENGGGGQGDGVCMCVCMQSAHCRTEGKEKANVMKQKKNLSKLEKCFYNVIKWRRKKEIKIISVGEQLHNMIAFSF